MPKTPLVPTEVIERRIYLIRRQKVMLDSDLAELYGVPTKVFNQAVIRNKERFPEDFMFQLSSEEWSDLRSQIVTSAVAGMFLSKPLALISISFFWIWVINSILTGMTGLYLQEKYEDADQSNSGGGH